ncbi:4'-phosphopantetheinyl transferase superfamily protein [Ancylobacter sp. 6x-1]|uniref:4'-phosphopantetheinyl transferase superfamily protein n=1 Tax=Ancylobacter crimeensis TaxID=2579147 RepID=A0ABT0D606_9HYPH|nr:4'-phosphopantetheinyl transferase superfamily protein [Ancylobacter crimeensis]MCK0195367.1 4'-phosphopantetheinyl transferase superfamily protein [Ancylobacter crimeensis]
MTFPCATRSTPADLTSDEVHVWTLGLDDLSPPDDATLDATERTRAGRFHFEKDRRRFIHCRSFMRRVLAGYLDRAPSAVPLVVGDHGKPGLATNIPLAFNLTHCTSAALLAVTRRNRIGIDAEGRATLDDLLGMIGLIFTAEEAAWVLTLPEDERQILFLRGWTRKEAVLKLSGEGLTIPPDRIIVPFEQDGPWRGSIPSGLAWGGTAFDLIDISTGPLIAALAVAATETPPVIRHFRAD